MNDNLKDAIDSVTSQIMVELSRYSLEYRHPMSGVDESEEKMNNAADKVRRLRDIRLKLEHICAELPESFSA